MKREHLRRLTALLATLIAAMMCGWLVSGCSKDCPTCPTDKPVEHYKGWLYYTDDAEPFLGVTVMDMETDSIVDSIRHERPAMEALGIDVSPDGRYLAVGFAGINDETRETRIYDAQTLQLLTVLPRLYVPLFVPGGDMLIGRMRDSMDWLAVPSFQVVRKDTTVEFLQRLIDPSRHIFYGSSTDSRGYYLYGYDYETRVLAEIPAHIEPGDTIQPIQMCLDAVRNRLYFRSLRGFNDRGKALLIAYDLTTHTVLWSYPTLSEVGSVAVSPDGSEVWMTDPGLPGYVFDSGTIYIFDANSGAYLQGISLFGYGPYPLVPLAGADIIFSPTGEKAYVSTGYAADRFTGSVLVVDTKLKKIIKVLTSDYMRSPMNLCIGPKT